MNHGTHYTSLNYGSPPPPKSREKNSQLQKYETITNKDELETNILQMYFWAKEF